MSFWALPFACFVQYPVPVPVALGSAMVDGRNLIGWLLAWPEVSLLLTFSNSQARAAITHQWLRTTLNAN